MRVVRPLVVAVLTFVILAVPSVALADGRVALALGNSTCAHIGRPPNTRNDATDMSGALQGVAAVGFEVTTKLEAEPLPRRSAMGVAIVDRGSGRASRAGAGSRGRRLRTVAEQGREGHRGTAGRSRKRTSSGPGNTAARRVPGLRMSICGPMRWRYELLSQQDLHDRILRSLHEVSFDATGWPETAGLIDVACGVKGNALVFGGERAPRDMEIHFAQFCFRGQRREDIERLYFRAYWARDERTPRMRRLPDSQLVHNSDLYTEAERKTSATYNEVQRLTETQDSVYARLVGPCGANMLWGLGDPVDAAGWGTERTRMIERLLPHVLQFLLVRQALVDARALGKSLAGLLDTAGTGVIHMDRNGRIVAANDLVVDLLRQRDGLTDQDGVLHAVEAADDVELQHLLERASPLFGGQGAAGSMTVGRSLGRPRLVLRVSPVGGRLTNFRSRPVTALVLVLDPVRKPRIDANAVASALGLTPTEASIAAMLATGRTVRATAAATGRKESTIRWHLKRIFAKHGVSRQADVVRLVWSVSPVAVARR